MWFEKFIDDAEYHHTYQPIYNLKDWVIFGYEVFLRSKEFSNLEETFELARKRKRLYDLDSQSIHSQL